MQLHLTDQEAHDLHDLLNDHLPTMRREIARTDSKEFRHLLVQRLDLVERIVGDLALTPAR